jgi:polar amino acid transport system substrate-binding protein
MAAFLKLLAESRIDVGDLITHRFPIEEADKALDVLTQPERRALAVVIEYGSGEPLSTTPTAPPAPSRSFARGKRVGFVGAGSFASRVLIPLAKQNGLELGRVATASGLSATSAAEQFGFLRGASTVDDLIDDNEIAGVFIATHHDLHGTLALAALQAGKAVFVEKPLCLTQAELEDISVELQREDAAPLMVGFNRRFAPATRALAEHLAGAEGPTNVLVRVNAGKLPSDHWLNDPEVGGGRLLGEGCHFLDLITQLVEADPVAVMAQANGVAEGSLQSAQDFSVSIRFSEGSLGTLIYGTTGAAQAGKEFVEAHRGTRSGQIDDFRRLQVWGAKRRTKRYRGQPKGHSEEIATFAAVVRGDASPPAPESYLVSTQLAFAALRSLQSGSEERVTP